MSESPPTSEKEIDTRSDDHPRGYTEFLCFGLICLIFGAGIGYGVHSMLPYTVEKTTLAYMIDRTRISYGDNIAGVNGELIEMSAEFGNVNNQSCIIDIYWVINEILVYRNSFVMDDGSDGDVTGYKIDLQPNDSIVAINNNSAYIIIVVHETFLINPVAQKIAELKA